MVGVVYSQSDALLREVFLTENIDLIAARADLHHQSFAHVTAVVIVQPTPATLHALTRLLGTHRYLQYHLFLTNIAPPSYLDSISRHDVHDYVKSVYEYYLDFYALSPSLFHLNNSAVTCTRRLFPRTNVPLPLRLSSQFDRDVSGLVALCLSQRKRPDIRYAASSHQAQTVAQSVAEVMRQQSELFTFGQDAASTLLLVLDRRDDPVTPLLTQWTYQAMVHELLGIHNNRIDMRGHNPAFLSSSLPSAPASAQREQQMRKDLQELVLSTAHDDFFRASCFCNFGEMGERIKSLVSHYQSVTHSNVKLDSIEALQEFVDKYPQYRQLSGNVSKHVALMTELSAIVNRRRLMAVSAVEQEIVCGNAHEHAELSSKIDALLHDQHNGQQGATFDFSDKLRVVVLYALRYAAHESSGLDGFKRTLAGYALDARDRERLQVVDRMLEYYNSNYGSVQTVNPSVLSSQQHARTAKRNELFENSKLLSIFRAVASEIKGVENIYTQHKPLLVSVLSRLLSGDLRLQDFPFVDQSSAKVKYRLVLVYIIGGVTYEEHAAVEAVMHIKGDAAASGSAPPSSSSGEPLASTSGRPSSASASASASASSLSTGGGGSGGAAPAEKKRFGDMLHTVKAVGKDVGSALQHASTSIASTALSHATTVSSSVQSALKFNPREFRVVLGGSCVLSSASFMNEVHHVDDDLFHGRLDATPDDGGDVALSSVEAAVNRQNAALAGRGRGGRGGPRGGPGGRGGRGGYMPVRGAAGRGGGRGGRGGGTLRGRGGAAAGGRGGYSALSTSDVGGGSAGNYHSVTAARPAGHGY